MVLAAALLMAAVMAAVAVARLTVPVVLVVRALRPVGLAAVADGGAAAAAIPQAAAAVCIPPQVLTAEAEAQLPPACRGTQRTTEDLVGLGMALPEVRGQRPQVRLPAPTLKMA